MEYLIKSETYIKLARWWLTFILCLLPFEFYITANVRSWNNDLFNLIRRLDLITIVILFPIALIVIYNRGRNRNGIYYFILLPFAVLGITGLISGIVNGNSLFMTCYGIFDYMQYFLVIFILAAFVRDFSELKKIFRILLVVALSLMSLAFIQELWALVSRYILNRDINDNGIYLFQYIEDKDVLESFWRFGIFRVSPFMLSPNIFGLYCLLMLDLYLYLVKNQKLSVTLSFLIGSLLTISRTVYLSCILILGIQIVKGKKWLLIVLIPLSVFMWEMSRMPDLNIVKLLIAPVTSELADNAEDNFRRETRDKAIEIWKDHPIWGIGPGMFGGVLSVKYQSPVYEEYNFQSNNQYLKRIWGIDQFWFQALAETGIIGIAAFAAIFISLISLFHYLKEKTEFDELQGLFKGLILFTIIIVTYAFGMMLNIAPVLFTYSAFVGMGLGCISNIGKK